jgi:hypothetical protein
LVKNLMNLSKNIHTFFDKVNRRTLRTRKLSGFY